ncbi:hypothetical protein QBC46DRAFT_338123 [Diplogelasinospora grovesii]|uniref:Polyketide synthase dehydratase domain-containing protein n=1 Tax=Diplogelasinospora grovesii TaxID=303347 RepID=A0AAN6NDJ6_9PEZI|nr:hypothetical protein QBC46DRAFT_338123 [Diplogelasinospora grovesii]
MPNEFETPYKMHPSVLDSMLQLPLLSLGTGGEASAECAYIPSAIRHFTISSRWRKRVNDSFCAHSTMEPRSDTFIIEMFSSQESEAASISIACLEPEAIKSAAVEFAVPPELCFQYKWQQVQSKEKEHDSNGETNGNASESHTKVVISVEKQFGVCPEISSIQAIKDWTSSL